MAVAECHEITGRDGSEDKLTNKRYVRKFRVLCDSPTDGAALVLAHDELPQRGSTWESVDAEGTVTDYDEDAFCVDRKAESSNNDLYHEWIVTISYAGKGDPLLEPPEIETSCVKFQVAMQKDWYGVWVVNSAGDPYENGITRDRTRFVVTIRQNVLDFDMIDAIDYIDTTNENTVFQLSNPPGFKPGLCKISELAAVAIWLEDHSAVHYWKRTAKVEIDREGWDRLILDAGFNKRVSILGIPTRVPIILPGGGKLSGPVPLDGAGNQLIHPADPVYLPPFTPYAPKDWSPLGLEWVTE